MKVSIVVLILFGVLAALCAMLLLAVYGVKKNGTGKIAEAQVLVALAKMEPGTVVETTNLQLKKIPRAQLPENACTDPIQAVGKIVAVPVVAGQAMTPAVFAADGTGLHVAGKLPPGRRAVTVSMPVEAGMRGLLYPGSVVDVLVSFRLQNNSKPIGEAVSTTLLEDIGVLAVEDKAVGAEPEDNKMLGGDKARAESNRSASKCLVTLNVDSKQAKALQLAAQFGTVSLAMRNPTDQLPVDKQPTLLSGGQLAEMASLLDALVKAQNPDEQQAAAEPTPTPEATPEPAPPPPPPAEVRAPEAPPQWSVEVYRGAKRETQTFAVK